MAHFTATQIGMVAWNAGIHDEPTLARAVAIALAESGGNAAAHNTNAATGDDSYGLWQINMTGAMGPARRKAFDIASNDALLDPQTNARAMFQVSNSGANWAPWSAFKSNAYMKHINAGKSAAKEVVGKAAAESPGNPVSWVFTQFTSGTGTAGNIVGNLAKGLDVGGAISASFNSLGASIMRLGLNAFAVIFAAILIILAIVIMLRAPMGKIAATVVGVAGPGKVAKGAAKVANAAKAVT